MVGPSHAVHDFLKIGAEGANKKMKRRSSKRKRVMRDRRSSARIVQKHPCWVCLATEQGVKVGFEFHVQLLEII